MYSEVAKLEKTTQAPSDVFETKYSPVNGSSKTNNQSEGVNSDEEAARNLAVTADRSEEKKKRIDADKRFFDGTEEAHEKIPLTNSWVEQPVNCYRLHADINRKLAGSHELGAQ
ncbi:unnamed protein product [Cylicocyclus nassatus]|uniref:Uncharacterized protein n=1 Tax=Cylicocyclus nassatus TaxID=53992 RepID=A0AA36H7X1_CYLNA|nr:unnamed protein product [Cylicocyclus nassatus]